MSIESLSKKIAESSEWSKKMEGCETNEQVVVTILKGSVELGEGDLTVSELVTFIDSLSSADDQELDDAELEAAAGGGWARRAWRSVSRVW
ncbi:hypothetical protein PJF56_10330 [Roseofilum sp. BLCC_M91]|uniref:Uncharacterized protein n=1 Tax=Roseofilum halophilum BLCC-M91 TaxID=3022259 RepID=A0ABT7BJ95_9CYAN|nr:hypothetical protein [Roseofilum halophilum]MDJ1179261.1 hypothetical protein [Roseofilum halophilum BLCC-M91]